MLNKTCGDYLRKRLSQYKLGGGKNAQKQSCASMFYEYASIKMLGIHKDMLKN